MSFDLSAQNLFKQDLPKKLYLDFGSDFKYAENLNGAYGLEVVEIANLGQNPQQAPFGFGLTLTQAGLCLRNFSKKAPDLFFDLTQPKLLYRLDTKRVFQETLLKAVRIKKSAINFLVDATLGTGIDALLLTNIAEKVLGFEENFYIYLLLKDAIYRAQKADILRAELEKLEIRNANSTQALQELNNSPEVIYLDPMFSDLNTKSQPKKNMNFMREILHSNLENTANADEEMQTEKTTQLLQTARKIASEKVVIKRPLRAKQDKQTTYQIKGKSIRFDVYFSGFSG